MKIIIVPDEGYSKQLYVKAIKMYHHFNRQDKNCLILVSGKTRNPVLMKSYGLKRVLEKYFNVIPVESQIAFMIEHRVSSQHILHENMSNHTRENALYSLSLIKDTFPTAEIYLLGTAEIFFRRYLTFQKAKKELSISQKMHLVPVFYVFPLITFFVKLLLIPGEIWRIWKYKKLGHL